MDDAMTEYDAINAGWPRCIIDLAAEKRRGGDEMAAERAALVEMSRNARPSLWSRFFP